MKNLFILLFTLISLVGNAQLGAVLTNSHIVNKGFPAYNETYTASSHALFLQALNDLANKFGRTPQTPTQTTLSGIDLGATVNKWVSSVYAENNCVYGVPSTSTQVIKV